MLCLFLWIFVHVVGESLPVSSSGHVALIEKLCGGRDHFFFPDAITQTLSHLLHGINLLILAIFFYQRWFFLFRETAVYCFSLCRSLLCIQNNEQKKRWVLHSLSLIIFALIADTITFIFYLFVPTYPLPLIAYVPGFIITALLLCLCVIVQRKNQMRQRALLYSPGNLVKKAVFLGFVQGCALLPGLSRLGSTYAAGILLGFSARQAFELSFVIQVPLLIGAFFRACYRLVHSDLLILNFFSFFHLSIILLLSSIVSWYAFELTWYAIRAKKIWWFSFYLSLFAMMILIVHALYRIK